MSAREDREIVARRFAERPRRTRGGWSIPCPRCGKRHVRRYSDDFVWCRACMQECADGGHEPDEDSPQRCYECGWSVRAGRALAHPPKPAEKET